MNKLIWNNKRTLRPLIGGIIAISSLADAAITVDFAEFNDAGTTKTRVSVAGWIDVSGLTELGQVNRTHSAPFPVIMMDGFTAAIDPGPDHTLSTIATSNYRGAVYNMETINNSGGFIMGTAIDDLKDLPFVCMSADVNILDVMVSDILLSPNSTVYEVVLDGDFASLDMIDGSSSTASWTNASGPESISFRVGSAITAVPEPSTFALMLPALGFIFKKRRAQS